MVRRLRALFQSLLLSPPLSPVAPANALSQGHGALAISPKGKRHPGACARQVVFAIETTCFVRQNNLDWQGKQLGLARKTTWIDKENNLDWPTGLRRSPMRRGESAWPLGYRFPLANALASACHRWARWQDTATGLAHNASPVMFFVLNKITRVRRIPLYVRSPVIAKL